MGTKKQSRPIFFFQKKSQNYALPNNLTLVTSFFFLVGLTTANKKSAISEFHLEDFFYFFHFPHFTPKKSALHWA